HPSGESGAREAEILPQLHVRDQLSARPLIDPRLRHLDGREVPEEVVGGKGNPVHRRSRSRRGHGQPDGAADMTIPDLAPKSADSRLQRPDWPAEPRREVAVRSPDAYPVQ